MPGCDPDAYDPNCAHMKHEGAYTELQIGPARTQMHTFPLEATTLSHARNRDGGEGSVEGGKGGEGGGGVEVAARGVYEWTEWFKAHQADPKVMQHADYSKPITAVQNWIHSPDGVSSAELAKVG